MCSTSTSPAQSRAPNVQRLHVNIASDGQFAEAEDFFRFEIAINQQITTNDDLLSDLEITLNMCVAGACELFALEFLARKGAGAVVIVRSNEGPVNNQTVLSSLKR